MKFRFSYLTILFLPLLSIAAYLDCLVCKHRKKCNASMLGKILSTGLLGSHTEINQEDRLP